MNAYHAVPSLSALFDLFENVFVRSTESKHGVALAKRYEKYVMAQKHPERVPFLLPEFRYLGAATKHKYRLDFTILSTERKLRVGIERSPWSSHGIVRGKTALRRKGGENAVEQKRQEQLEDEMEKRNAYFKKYGITTLTFTGKALAIRIAYSIGLLTTLNCTQIRGPFQGLKSGRSCSVIYLTTNKLLKPTY